MSLSVMGSVLTETARGGSSAGMGRVAAPSSSTDGMRGRRRCCSSKPLSIVCWCRAKKVTSLIFCASVSTESKTLPMRDVLRKHEEGREEL